MDLFGGFEAVRAAAGEQRTNCDVTVLQGKPDRGYARVGARSTILTGSGRLGPPTTGTQSWFHHRRFSSPLTKE